MEKRLKTCEYRLMFVDVNMPVKDGIETTATIRRMCKGCVRQPYIVGVTGFIDSIVEETCKAAGMDRICKSIWLTSS